MMQQLATQSSQIAALPGGQVNPKGTTSADSANRDTSNTRPDAKAASKEDFSDVLDKQSRQISKDDETSKTAHSSRADDTSHNKSTNEKQVKADEQEAKSEDKPDTSGDEQKAASEQQADAEANSHDTGTDKKAVADSSSANKDPDSPQMRVDDVGADQDKLVTSDDSSEVVAEQSNKPDGVNWHYSQSDSAELVGDQPDYLAFIDNIRALQDKLNNHDAPETSELLNADINELKLNGWKQSNGEPLPDEVLNDLQELLATLLPDGTKVESEGSAVQQIADAETLLSNVLTLVKQLNKAAGEADQTSTPEQADTLLHVLAAELLRGLDSDKNNTVSGQDNSIEANIGDVQIDLSDVANIQLAEDAIIVAESGDQTLQNQASLLVSLMRQLQASNSQGGSEGATGAKTANQATANNRNPAESLEALLSQASDSTVSELAQVMTDSASKTNPLLTDNQLSQIRSQLVTGMEEIRSQLKQGHEPGIDLAALVTQTIKDVAPDMMQGQNAMLPVMQEAQQLASLASLANLGSSQERQIAELVAVSRDVVSQDVRQHHGDTMKSMQQQANLEKPVAIQQQQGQQQIAEKIRWMVNGRQAMAEIRLDPPELGSMQVRLNVSGDSAAVSFVVQSQHAKEALAETIPRLRDMFAEQGLELGESFVSQQQNNQQESGEAGQHSRGGFDEDPDESKAQETAVVRPANGLIDDYV